MGRVQRPHNLYFDRLKNKAKALSAEDQAKLAAQNNFVDELIKALPPRKN